MTKCDVYCILEPLEKQNNLSLADSRGGGRLPLRIPQKPRHPNRQQMS
jgi:hypothetical protein